MKKGVDKVKWLMEKGPLTQYNQKVRVLVDRKTGDTTISLEDNMKMNAKVQNKREQKQ